MLMARSETKPSCPKNQTSHNFAHQVAQCALHHYHHNLPRNNGGKPQQHEWTVYAAIVACRDRRDTRDDNGTSRGPSCDTAANCDNCQTAKSTATTNDEEPELWVVSCATGSKCTSVHSAVSSFPRPRIHEVHTNHTSDDAECHAKNSSSISTKERHPNTPNSPNRCDGKHGKHRGGKHAKNARHNVPNVTSNNILNDLDDPSICDAYQGMVLKDSHAETLARRGLIAVLWDEIEHSLSQLHACLENSLNNRNSESGQKAQKGEGLDRLDGLDVEQLEEAVRRKSDGRHVLEIVQESLRGLEGKKLNTDDTIDTDDTTSKTSTSANLNAKPSIQFRLRKHITLQMYISDSPCGDAAIYEIERRSRDSCGSCDPGEHDEHDARESNNANDTLDAETAEARSELRTQRTSELNFTGAKIILSGNSSHNAIDAIDAIDASSATNATKGTISSILTCSTPNNVTVPSHTDGPTVPHNETNESNESSNPNNPSNPSNLDCSNTGHAANAANAAITLGREGIQQLGAIRIKSSRSNIPPQLRSTSLSCSDKLVRWGVLGLQGGLLSSFIARPICLELICVGRDPRGVVRSHTYDGVGKVNEQSCCSGYSSCSQSDALERALTKRIQRGIESLPKSCGRWNMKPPRVAVVDCTFEHSKSASEHRYDRYWRENASTVSRKMKRGLDDVVQCPKCQASNAQEPTEKRVKVLKVEGKEGNRTSMSCNDGSSLTSGKKSSVCECHEGTSSLSKQETNHDQLTNAKQKKQKKEPSSGMSINWHQPHPSHHPHTSNTSNTTHPKDGSEITIGATGMKRGKKPKVPREVLRCTSRLSRFHFAIRCRQCLLEYSRIREFVTVSQAWNDGNDSASHPNRNNKSNNTDLKHWSYAKCKEQTTPMEFSHAVSTLLNGVHGVHGDEGDTSDGCNGCDGGPLVGWIRSGKGDDFVIPILELR